MTITPEELDDLFEDWFEVEYDLRLKRSNLTWPKTLHDAYNKANDTRQALSQALGSYATEQQT